MFKVETENLINFEKNLSENSSISLDDVKVIGPLFFELKKYINLSYDDFDYITYVYPNIYNEKIYNSLNNLLTFSKLYNLQSIEVKYLILKSVTLDLAIF